MIEIRKAKLPRDLKVLDRLDKIAFNFKDPVYLESWKKYQNFILFVDDKPVGYISVQPHTGLYSYETKIHEKKRGALHLTVIGVMPSHRRRGLGELLMAFATAYGRIGKFKSMNATTRQSNKVMQTLFKKFGFKITKKIKKFYPDGEAAVVEEFFL